MPEFNLAGFAKFLAEEMNDNIEKAREVALRRGAEMIRDEARRVIGTHEYSWVPLAESTKADRVAKGFPEDEPLLRTGELRDSIEFTIVIPGELAEIGSNSDIAVYQELGTSTIPARSFLAGAAAFKGQEVADVAATLVHAAMEQRSLAGEIAKIAVEAAERIKRSAETILPFEDDDETSRKH